MKYCQYTWAVRLFAKKDAYRNPIESKEIVCELPHGHRGPHKSGTATSPNIQSRNEDSGDR